MTTPITKDGEYTTRDEREVRIYATDAGGVFPVHGAYKTNDRWTINYWRANGKILSSGEDHPMDLIPKPKVRKLDVWLNVDDNGYVESFRDRRAADMKAVMKTDGYRIACIHIQRDVAEGEGLGDA